MSKRKHVKPYPRKLRKRVVKMARVSGRRPREIAGKFGISPDSVRRWVKQADLVSGPWRGGLAASGRRELARLRGQVRRLRKKRETLKGLPGLARRGD